MTAYIIYNTTTGKITQSVATDRTVDAGEMSGNAGGGETYLIVDDYVNPDEFYYNTASSLVIARPLLSTSNSWSATTVVADGATAITFGSSLPAGTDISVVALNRVDQDVEPATTTVNDGILSLAFDVTGSYTVRATVFPYQDYEQQIEAT